MSSADHTVRARRGRFGTPIAAPRPFDAEQRVGAKFAKVSNNIRLASLLFGAVERNMLMRQHDRGPLDRYVDEVAVVTVPCS